MSLSWKKTFIKWKCTFMPKFEDVLSLDDLTKIPSSKWRHLFLP